MWDWLSIVCCFVDVLKIMSCSCSMCLFYTSLVSSWTKLSWSQMKRWLTESPTLRDGLVLVLAVMLGQWCLVVFIRQQFPWVSWCFCSPPCFDAVFCCVAKSRGIPITPSNSQCHWGTEGCWDQRQASKVPSFGLSAHCQSAVVSRGTSLLGMKCPDEKNVMQSTRIFRCCFFWWVEWRRVVTDIAIVCHQKLWDSRVLDVKNNTRWNIHIERGTQFPRQQRKGWTMVISKEKSYEFWILMDGS